MLVPVEEVEMVEFVDIEVAKPSKESANGP